jgi:hypothetical protein
MDEHPIDTYEWTRLLRRRFFGFILPLYKRKPCHRIYYYIPYRILSHTRLMEYTDNKRVFVKVSAQGAYTGSESLDYCSGVECN